MGEGGLNLYPTQLNWKERRFRAPTRVFTGSLDLDLNSMFFEIVFPAVTHPSHRSLMFKKRRSAAMIIYHIA